MGLILTMAAVSVTIAGTAYPLAQVQSLSEELAPQVDAVQIAIPWGGRKVSGSSDPTEDLPALGAAVVVTSGAATWRGILSRRSRVAQGSRRQLSLTAHGPGLALDRSYLPTFARSGVSGVVQADGGPRFAPRTRSSTAGGPGSTYYLGGSGDWNVGQALSAVLGHASLAGLPAITLVDHGADLTRVLPDTACDGLSFHATIQAILGHRMGLGWRMVIASDGSWQLHTYSLTGTGSSVDLSTGDVTGYEVSDDASATLADLTVRGARKQYVISVDAYVASAGDLVKDWSSGDVTARTGGDLGSPAYRRFRLAVFALPDGSPSVTAEPVPTLPIAAETSLTRGSSPWLVYAQLTAGSTWISLQGRVSVSAGGSAIWIEGIDPAEWATWNRIRVTMCLSPRACLSEDRTSGAGLGHGVAIVGARHAYASGAAVRVSGGSLATVTGSAGTDSQVITDEAGALWAALGSHQVVATWSRRGRCATTPAPGDRITSIVLPVPGSASTTITCDLTVTNRRVTWAGGVPTTTWQCAPRPFAAGALL